MRKGKIAWVARSECNEGVTGLKNHPHRSAPACYAIAVPFFTTAPPVAILIETRGTIQ
jgi:hypothetical protein